MKWALVTNFGNPGDEFARIGVEELIKATDPAPEFIYIRRDPPKDCEEIPVHIPRDFDIAVVCSMPGFWSHPDRENRKQHNSPMSHHAWEPYHGWLASKGTLLFAGFGLYLTYRRFPLELEILNRDYTVRAFNVFLRETCFDYYCRNSLGRAVFGQSTPCHPCPSIFAGRNMERKRDLKIANFMQKGAHYPWMDPREADKMQLMLPKLARYLIDDGYTFVAHRDIEVDVARQCGWADDEIIAFDGNAHKLLEVYSRASHYFGNRIHGAIVSRSFGAHTFCLGYDTRLRAVEDVGGIVSTPRKFKPAQFREWLSDSSFELDLNRLFSEQLPYFRRVFEKAKNNLTAG